MSIQFAHIRVGQSNKKTHVLETSPRGGKTFAIDLPNSWLFRQVVEGDSFTRSVGSSRCSDKDNYNKALGRGLAKSRMKPTKLTVLEVRRGDRAGELFVYLTDVNGNIFFVKAREDKETPILLGVSSNG